eukprot:gene571-615_t
MSIGGSAMVGFPFLFLLIFTWIPEGKCNGLNPVRYPTEEAFFRANTHERSSSFPEMEKKIDAMRQRRHFQAWNISNPLVAEKVKVKRPNILFILADDLGYGDLSVEPFTTPHDENWPCSEGGILTPHLEQMAAEGMILTNFHAAAPVCSPSRAAIMTGLYAWRLNAMNAFEVSREDMSQLDGFLPQVPTIAEYLREEGGYYTAHSGKWHIGGMREENRRARANSDDCSVPGPNQHGFEDYISALDGPESPRYSFLNRNPEGLHMKGHRHRIQNDIPVPNTDGPSDWVLSDYEAEDAIGWLKKAKKEHPGQPWFLQVWFNAPHGPWELLRPGEDVYSKHYRKTHEHWAKMQCSGGKYPLYSHPWHYKTMVTAMDRSIGRLMTALKELGYEDDTLVIFTSDNGPENGVGTGGDFREGKRSLLEGGLRVPLVMKWKNVIPAGVYSTVFTAHTDLLPTFLHAAKLPNALQRRFDGLSLLPIVSKAVPVPSDKQQLHHYGPLPEHHGAEKEWKRVYFSDAHLHAAGSRAVASSVVALNHSQVGHARMLLGGNGLEVGNVTARDRVFLFHTACDPYHRNDPRRRAGGVYEELKVLVNREEGCLDAIFDLRLDSREEVNLVSPSVRSQCSLNLRSVRVSDLTTALLSEAAIKHHCGEIAKHGISSHEGDESHHAGESAEHCQSHYRHRLFRKLSVILTKLKPFFLYGKQGWQNYMDEDFKKAICAVPHASQAKSMRFKERSDCEKNGPNGCTEPEYVSWVALSGSVV